VSKVQHATTKVIMARKVGALHPFAEERAR